MRGRDLNPKKLCFFMTGFESWSFDFYQRDIRSLRFRVISSCAQGNRKNNDFFAHFLVVKNWLFLAGEFTKRVREKSSQLFVALYTLSIYPSAHNQLRRHLPKPFREFPCTIAGFMKTVSVCLIMKTIYLSHSTRKLREPFSGNTQYHNITQPCIFKFNTYCE